MINIFEIRPFDLEGIEQRLKILAIKSSNVALGSPQNPLR